MMWQQQQQLAIANHSTRLFGESVAVAVAAPENR